MRKSWSLARRELAGFFHSPVAYIFIAAFLAVSLFVVFWVDTFFARNLADVKPLFQWMPVLLIFLVSAITMRMWSEERRSGTLESLLTSPVTLSQMIFGKFLACLILVAIALLLTLGLPITVSFIGPLDWGPVIGGYIAALLLASTYIAVGLYISARTDNQIVSLIITVIVGILLYLPGSHLLEAFFSTPVSHWLRLVGTGARFDSITRGVLDLRDLYYYLSLALSFLVLNGMALTRLRWGRDGRHKAEKKSKRQKAFVWMVALIIINLLGANVWLASLTGARVDLTQGQLYTLSSATKNQLSSLSEPLLIEGFFSHKTHPLLAPLVPQLKSLLREYGIAGGSNVTVKFADPQKEAGLAKKIAKRYDIKPVPFRNQSRYEASVVNAYFDILIKYGDQHKVLSFQNLIGVDQSPGGDLKVDLKAPEYDITNAITSVVGKYQKKGDIFVSIGEPVTLHAFISKTADLPKPLASLQQDLTSQLAKMKQKADGKLVVSIKHPHEGGKLAKTIADKYGFQPMVASLLNPEPFYFYLLLQRGDQTVPVPLPDDLKGDSLKKALKAGLGQFAKGIRKTVTIFAPKANPMLERMGRSRAPQFTHLLKALRQHDVVKQSQLKKGHVPDGTQLLLVMAPNNIGKKQLFAIDQFLMTGGTVVVAASPFSVSVGQQGLVAHKGKTGLADWLAAKGINIQKKLVLDEQNTIFPVPVYRHLGGLSLREYYPMPYPYFPNISGDGLNSDFPATRGLGQVTMSWPSPIKLDKSVLKDDKVMRLLSSSKQSWTSDSTHITPDRNAQGKPLPWQPSGKLQSRLLGVAVEGQFDSWFKNRDNPLLASQKKTSGDKKGSSKTASGKQANKDQNKPVYSSVIDHSPAASRLVVLSSSSFATDNSMDLISAGLGRTYDQPVQLVQNLVDWSLESPAMMQLRNKSSVSRMLRPLDHGQQVFWEYFNYGLAIFGLIIVGLIAWLLRRRHYRKLSDWLTRQGV